MNLERLWQLAQFKFAGECSRADHNLLLVVHHASLLYSLNNHFLGHETIQPSGKELATSKTKAGGRDTSSNQLHIMNGVTVSTTGRAHKCSRHSPILIENRNVEEIEESEDDEGRKREATSNLFQLSHISSEGREQPVPASPRQSPASFSKHGRRRSKTNPLSDPSDFRSFAEISTRVLDSKEASIISSIVGEVRADITLDKIIEAAGCTF